MSLSVNATANMLVDKIAALQDEVSSGKTKYSEQAKQAKKYKKRLKQLKKIRSNVKSRFDDNVSSIKSQQTNLRSKLAQATSGLSYESTLTSSIQDDKEKAVESDVYMSDVLENIETEISACDSKSESATEQANATKNEVNEKVDIIKGYIYELKQLMQTSDSPLTVASSYLKAPSKIA